MSEQNTNGYYENGDNNNYYQNQDNNNYYTTRTATKIMDRTTKKIIKE